MSTTDMVVTFPGGAKVDAHFMGVEIKTDQSVKSGGEGSAPEPFVLFLASIATCAGIYVARFCQSRHISTDDIRVVQKLTPLPSGKGIGEIALEIEVPPSFPEKYHAAIMRVADQCAVKKTILDPPQFSVRTVVRDSPTQP